MTKSELDEVTGRLMVALSELDAALDLRRATLVHVSEARQLVKEALDRLQPVADREAHARLLHGRPAGQ